MHANNASSRTDASGSEHCSPKRICIVLQDIAIQILCYISMLYAYTRSFTEYNKEHNSVSKLTHMLDLLYFHCSIPDIPASSTSH